MFMSLRHTLVQSVDIVMLDGPAMEFDMTKKAWATWAIMLGLLGVAPTVGSAADVNAGRNITVEATVRDQTQIVLGTNNKVTQGVGAVANTKAGRDVTVHATARTLTQVVLGTNNCATQLVGTVGIRGC